MIDFPNNPNLNDTHDLGAEQYVYDGQRWIGTMTGREVWAQNVEPATPEPTVDAVTYWWDGIQLKKYNPQTLTWDNSEDLT